MRAAPPNREGIETRAIDQWLRREFSALYNTTLNEKLPPELLALINATH